MFYKFGMINIYLLLYHTRRGRMTKRIALVTGGMGGIGQAICRELSQQKIRVVAGYFRHGNHESALEWQLRQKELGYDFDIAYVDVADFKSCESLVNKIQNEIGCIDILVNNAGITRDCSCCKMST